MSDVVRPRVRIPSFRESSYLSENQDARDAVEAGASPSGLDHFLAVGIDERRSPRLRREPAAMQGGVERSFVSDSGFYLLLGWLADEGHGPLSCTLAGADFTVDLPPESMFRHARQDVEQLVRPGAYDFGFVIFGSTPSKSLLKQPFLFQANTATGTFQSKTAPELVSDRSLLDTILIFLRNTRCHAGKECALYGFMESHAGTAMVDIFRCHVQFATHGHYVKRFRPRPVSRSFITVLFGSTEPMLLQPLLFRQQGIDFGEWIYVCNSPEDANAALRLGRMIAELYDVMITVLLMTDNAGFGAANNVAIGHASSDRIYIINPDVYPIAGQKGPLLKTLTERDLGDKFWGGLLFYDDENLMHSGMFLDRDLYHPTGALPANRATDASLTRGLLRCEHFDKGVPFMAEAWQRPRVVPAVSGAVMAFERPVFERLNGFSTRYIYGHYEDADLSLRWAAEAGPVVIDPDLRLVHLEGQGSRPRGEQYGGASLINRYLFSLQYNQAFDEHEDFLTRSHELRDRA